MKQIEAKNKKNVLVSSFAKFFRVGILSLFVMLVIPSISSGIFGNGDAKAACNQRSDAGLTFVPDLKFLEVHCKHEYDSEDPDNNVCLGDDIENIAMCTPETGTGTGSGCKVVSRAIRCVNINSPDACIEASNHCVYTVEDVNNNKLVDAVCRVYQIATGTAGKAFAAVGVISVGIGFFTGKVSWGLMISVAAGIAVFFGAPSIIAVISGDQTATALCSGVSS